MINDTINFLNLLARDRYVHCFYRGATIIAKHLEDGKQVQLVQGNSINITVDELLDSGLSDEEAEELNGFGWYIDDNGYLAFDVPTEIVAQL